MPPRQLTSVIGLSAALAGMLLLATSRHAVAATALTPPAGYLQAVRVKRTQLSPCEAAPPPFTSVLDFPSKYEGSGASRDALNADTEAKYKGLTQPITDMERRFSSLVMKYMKSGDPSLLECALTGLATWADAGALLGEAPNHTGRSVRKWALASFSSAYLRLKWSSSAPLKSYPQQSARLEAWFGSIADRVKNEWPVNAPLKQFNNHFYWAGWSMMATALATNRRDLFDQAVAIYRIFASQVDAEGFLPNELARGSRAAEYHSYALQPIAMIAAFGKANNVDLAAEGKGALARLAQLVHTGFDNLEIFRRKSGVQQDPASISSTSSLAWMEPYCWTVACGPDMQSRLATLRPVLLTRLGGDLTAIFKTTGVSVQVSDALIKLNQNCRAVIDSGEYDEALSRCKSAVFNAEKLAPGSKQHITGLVNVGDLKRLENNYVETDMYYTDALLLVARSGDEETEEDAATLLDKLIDVKVKRGKFLESERLMRQLIAVTESNALAGESGIAALRARHADLLSQSHQFPVAEKTYNEAIAVLKRAGTESFGAYAAAVQHLAETYERQAKYQQAEDQYQELANVLERHKTGVDKLAVALERLAYVCEQQEKWLQAAAVYQREMNVLRESGAPEEATKWIASKLTRLAAAQQPGIQ